MKILWAASAGRCSFTECLEKLCSHEARQAAPFTIGEMAHICGENPGSNRHDTSQTDAERDDYSNLILLCPTHHRLIDRNENESIYSVQVLHEMKIAHETQVMRKLDEVDHPCKFTLANELLVLLTENRECWLRYGPASEAARKEPNNEDIFAVWVSERLATIVPNNRKMSAILRAERGTFEPAQQGLISSFLIHARSYEKWVQDEVPYSAVVRFPTQFEDMIRKVADARL